MFMHNKRLQYTVRVSEPNPVLASLLLLRASAQRALRHFVHILRGHILPLDSAREQVRLAMNALVKPTVPKRERKSDAEIAELIEQNWARLNGSGAALLRYLRDEALVACEQSRFAMLRRDVQAQLHQKAKNHG